MEEDEDDYSYKKEMKVTNRVKSISATIFIEPILKIV